MKFQKIQRGDVVYAGHDSWVPHNDQITITCDTGYVLFNTTKNTERFTCDRSIEDTMEPFGPSVLVRCVGKYYIAETILTEWFGEFDR